MEQQTNNNSLSNQPTFWQQNKVILKALLIAFFCFLLLLPQSLIKDLIRDRQNHQTAVTEQLAKQISREQIIHAPIIVVPFTETRAITEEGKTKVELFNDYLYLMPEQLNIKANAPVNETHRIGIYKLPVFESTIKINGFFKNTNWQQAGIAEDKIQWANAKLVVSIADFKGLKAQPKIVLDGVTYNTNIGTKDYNNLNNVVYIPLNLTTQWLAAEHSFACNLELRGSNALSFVPVGNNNNIQLVSNWKSPLAIGDHTVNLNKNIAKEGTNAQWNILGINRNFAQVVKGLDENLHSESVGILFNDNVNTYDSNMRSAKYALLIIALTFVISFFVEQLQQKRVHPLQYALVGFALLVFYTLLLSISEYLGFKMAYLISATAVTALISWYSIGLYNQKTGLMIGIYLLCTYAFLYVLIVISDGSLLLGSIGLFIVIALGMFVSKKINWYQVKE